MKVLVVIVFYNNRAEVERFIHDTAVDSTESIDVAVVVNSDKNLQVDLMVRALIESNLDNVHVFDFGANVGYLNALLEVIDRVNILF